MNALQVLAACKEQSLSLSSYALLRESAQSGTPEKEILSRFDQMLAVMKASAEKALEAPVRLDRSDWLTLVCSIAFFRRSAKVVIVHTPFKQLYWVITLVLQRPLHILHREHELPWWPG